MTGARANRLHRALFSASLGISAILAFALAFEANSWALIGLFLGDSCTFQGYPELVEGRLSQRPGARLEVESVNVGVQHRATKPAHSRDPDRAAMEALAYPR
jgi:hypothetical protein